MNTRRHIVRHGVRAGRVPALACLAAGVACLHGSAHAVEGGRSMNMHEASSRAIEILPGENDLVVAYQAAPAMQLQVTLEEDGQENAEQAIVRIDNPFALNGRFHIRWRRGMDGARGRDTRAQALHYTVPWGDWLLALSTSRGRYRQTRTRDSAAPRYSVVSRATEVGLSRTVHRDAVSATSVGVRVIHGNTRRLTAGAEMDSRRHVTNGLELALKRHQRLGSSTLDAHITYRKGSGAFRAMEAPEAAWSDGDTDGPPRTKRVIAELQYTQPLRMGEHAARLSSTWHAQWHLIPLGTQSRFSIGGWDTVRGFDADTLLSAERGWFWRNELATPIRARMEMYLALDAGRVDGPSVARLQGQSLTGVALGVRGTWGRVQYEAFVGRPLHKPEHVRTADSTFGVSAYTYF